MSPTIKLLLLAAVPFLSTAAAQDDIISGGINGNGISCIGNNACCEGTVLTGEGSEASNSYCCPEESGGNVIGGQGTMCATGTAVPMTEGVTISAQGAAATTSMDSSSAASTTMDMSTVTSMSGGDSTSMAGGESTSMASSSTMAASTSSGMGAAKTVGVMGPAALGMGAMAVGFGMF